MICIGSSIWIWEAPIGFNDPCTAPQPFESHKGCALRALRLSSVICLLDKLFSQTLVMEDYHWYVRT